MFFQKLGLTFRLKITLECYAESDAERIEFLVEGGTRVGLAGACAEKGRERAFDKEAQFVIADRKFGAELEAVEVFAQALVVAYCCLVLVLTESGAYQIETLVEYGDSRTQLGTDAQTAVVGAFAPFEVDGDEKLVTEHRATPRNVAVAGSENAAGIDGPERGETADGVDNEVEEGVVGVVGLNLESQTGRQAPVRSLPGGYAATEGIVESGAPNEIARRHIAAAEGTAGQIRRAAGKVHKGSLFAGVAIKDGKRCFVDNFTVFDNAGAAVDVALDLVGVDCVVANHRIVVGVDVYRLGNEGLFDRDYAVAFGLQNQRVERQRVAMGVVQGYHRLACRVQRHIACGGVQLNSVVVREPIAEGECRAKLSFAQRQLFGGELQRVDFVDGSIGYDADEIGGVAYHLDVVVACCPDDSRRFG